jgi:hypothetical protein
MCVGGREGLGLLGQDLGRWALFGLAWRVVELVRDYREAQADRQDGPQ